MIAIAMGISDWLRESEDLLVAYAALQHSDSNGEASWEPSPRLTYAQWMRVRECGCSDPLEVVYEIVPKSEDSNMGWALFSAEQIDPVGP